MEQLIQLYTVCVGGYTGGGGAVKASKGVSHPFTFTEKKERERERIILTNKKRKLHANSDVSYP